MAQLQSLKRKNHPMISPVTGSNPNKRTARFRNPSVTSLVPGSNPNKGRKPDVEFLGWRDPLDEWAEWVDIMEALHGDTWREAGIHRAILSSKRVIEQDATDIRIVLELAHRWSSVTNTFMFPMAEATMSLDDVAAIGGYSLSGRFVMSLDTDDEVVRKNGLLMKVRKEMNASSYKKVGQSQWLRKFMKSGHELEHEAFLVLWLSRQVFPHVKDVVGKHLHKLAIVLARGTRVALAPVVLACLYHDLNLLNGKIVEKRNENEVAKTLNLWAPMQLVVLWAWERFPALSPRLILTEKGEPLIRKRLSADDIKSALEKHQ